MALTEASESRIRLLGLEVGSEGPTIVLLPNYAIGDMHIDEVNAQYIGTHLTGQITFKAVAGHITLRLLQFFAP